MTIEKPWAQQKINPIKIVRKISHLLWWDLIIMSPHVHLLVRVHTGEDEEHPRAAGPACQQQTQSENDSSLVFLAEIFRKLSHLSDDSQPDKPEQPSRQTARRRGEWPRPGGWRTWWGWRNIFLVPRHISAYCLSPLQTFSHWMRTRSVMRNL